MQVHKQTSLDNILNNALLARDALRSSADSLTLVSETLCNNNMAPTRAQARKGSIYGGNKSVCHIKIIVFVYSV